MANSSRKRGEHISNSVWMYLSSCELESIGRSEEHTCCPEPPTGFTCTSPLSTLFHKQKDNSRHPRNTGQFFMEEKRIGYYSCCEEILLIGDGASHSLATALRSAKNIEATSLDTSDTLKPNQHCVLYKADAFRH